MVVLTKTFYNLWPLWFYIVSSDDLGAHVLELPYKGGDISLFIILPPFNKQRGISMLTKRLNTNILQDIVSSSEWRSRSVEVSLPKFSVEQSMDNLVPVSVYYECYETCLHDPNRTKRFCSRAISGTILSLEVTWVRVLPN